jgi:hypothetical protein
MKIWLIFTLTILPEGVFCPVGDYTLRIPNYWNISDYYNVRGKNNAAPVFFWNEIKWKIKIKLILSK